MENLIVSSPAVSLPPPQVRLPDSVSRSSVSLSLSLPRKAIPIPILTRRLASGRLIEAVEALESLAGTGFKITPDAYSDLLDGCIDGKCLRLGRRLHSLFHLVDGPCPFVETKLVSMYAKCGSLSESRQVFGEMRERDLFAWSAMIGAFSRDGRWREVLGMFYSMMADDSVLPDAFLFPKILQACGNCEDLETGKLIHSLAIRGGTFKSERVSNSILSVYVKCGKLSLARRVFDDMEERDVVSWNSLISGYSQKGQSNEALKLFDAMVAEGTEPSVVTWNTLIAGHCHSGNCDIAMELMKKMDDAGMSPDVFTWTTVISGFAQNGKQIQAIDLFRDMVLGGVEPNGVTIASVVSACASLLALDRGEEMHTIAFKLGLADNVLVGNSLVDVYSKCGEPESARKVFDSIHEKDIYSWNSMIGGYFQAGYCGKAHELFLKMHDSNIPPNVITWNAMISGYMQNGDEDQGINLFHQMEKEGKIRRNTASWNSIIAGYAQNGWKDRAFGVLRQMQSSGFLPNWVTILSILPSCANLVSYRKVKEIHACTVRRGLWSVLPVVNSLIDSYAKSGDIGYARKAFDEISRRDIIAWNAMLGGYVLHGRPSCAIDILNEMRAAGIKPNRGTFLSLLSAYSQAGEVNKGVEAFSSITREYLIVPALEHYAVVVDLYGRAGRLEEAVEFIEQMPVDPDSSVWLALFAAGRIHGNSDCVLMAAERLLELEYGNLSLQPLILNTFALYGKTEHALKLKKLGNGKDGLPRRTVSQSWIETPKAVKTFLSSPTLESHSEQLIPWVKSVEQKAKEVKYCEGGLYIEEEEKEETGGIHSEKLAIGFALLSSAQPPRSVRVMKSTRICEDCHRTVKYISSAYECEIYLSDTRCLHHFKGGNCSCGDYW